jgi:hypothetical protein
MADLGYFIGYAICGAYYRQAKDKQQAIRDIIELNYADTAATERFLKRSGYITDPYDRAALLAALAKKVPVVTGLTPFANGDSTVDPSLKELTIQFSVPMQPGRYSIITGEKGKDSYPVTKVTGFGAESRSVSLAIALQPGHEYEFITGPGFRSVDGYSLQPYTVHFKTRP